MKHGQKNIKLYWDTIDYQ